MTTTSGLCPPGYYCPQGSRFATEYACPNGTYNDDYGIGAESDCKNCTQGHYCEEAFVAPVECAAGTYMPYGVTPASSTTNPYVPVQIGPGMGQYSIVLRIAHSQSAGYYR
jgi:hypothetical protein